MGKRYLMDSNAVVDFLGGKLPESGRQVLLKISPEISIITFIEIFSKKGLPDADTQKYRSFTSIARIYSEINDVIAEVAIGIRKKYGSKTPDAIIAATAIVNNLILVTRNEKDFINIHKLEIINPWKV